MTSIQLNNLVAVDNKYGVGKVIAINDTTADVRFFLNITKQITETYPIEELEVVYLSPQTRVYVKGEDQRWMIGRIVDYTDATNPEMDYEIKFPNHIKAWYGSDEIEVRCLLPTTDPTEVLSSSGGETQYLYESRKKVQEWLIKLRASSRGLTALSSASIDLVIHQVNIARRILNDPIQRYLLSDEVGMGKTIEAGIVARQCLLDSDDSEVLIIVPKHLIVKWEKEMLERFYFNDFPDRYKIVSPENVSNELNNPDLIIIDEAHHIIGSRGTYSEFACNTIINMAKNSNKLLLLSATPGIGNEDILLNLLKVLDPVSFESESLESFKEKVLTQVEHGAFLRRLKVKQKAHLLKRSLPRIPELFPNDVYAESLGSQILDIVDDEDQEEKRFFLVKQLRLHLVETWRLHNRLIRTRRVDSEGWEFQDRGKKEGNEYSLSNISLLDHPNSVLEKINFQIEEWRSYISLKLEIKERNYTKAQDRYLSLLEASNADFETLNSLLNVCKEQLLIDTELEYLEKISEAVSDYNYLEKIDEVSKRIKLFINDISPTSIGVVFISDIKLAKKYLSSLQSIFGEGEVYIFESDDTNNSTAVQSSKTRIIICDEFAEEGVDLQFCDAIIHLDLPLNPSRIEQRIGRLDRYGRTKSLKIQHLIFLPTNDSTYPWLSWYNLLIDGFHVFHEPISDIQLKLESITENIRNALFQYGVLGIEEHLDKNENIDGSLVDYISSLIVTERDSLEEQYSLNHLSLRESESLNIRDKLEDAEEDEKGLEADINHWLFEILKFGKFDRNDKVFEIEWVTKGKYKTLIPKQQFWSKSGSITTNMWAGEFNPTLNRNLSYYRQEAVEDKSVSLLRPGHPLFTTLQHYMDWEDRGTAFSTFRVVEENFPIMIYRGEIKIMFKLHFIVEAGFPTEVLQQDYNSDYYSYMRRTDDYLPPKIFTVYIDENLNVIEDEDITDALDEPYLDSTDVDTNLSSRRSIIDHFIDPDKLTILCKDISQRSKDILLNSSEYRTSHIEALKKVKTDVELKCTNLERRKSVQDESNITVINHEYKKLVSFEKSLISGIEAPNIKLDSFGMFFLSKHPINVLKDLDE